MIEAPTATEGGQVHDCEPTLIGAGIFAHGSSKCVFGHPWRHGRPAPATWLGRASTKEQVVWIVRASAIWGQCATPNQSSNDKVRNYCVARDACKAVSAWQLAEKLLATHD